MSDDRHLEPEVIYALQAGDLADVESQQAYAHLETCGLCQAEAQLAASFAETASTPIERGVSQRIRSRVMPAPVAARSRAWFQSPWLQRGLLAASVVLAAIGIRELMPRELDVSTGDAVRAGASEQEWNVQAVSSAAQWEFSWQAQPGAGTYQVTLQSARGESLWITETERTRASISKSDLTELLTADGLYFIGVSFAADGVRQQSPLVSIAP